MKTAERKYEERITAAVLAAAMTLSSRRVRAADRHRTPEAVRLRIPEAARQGIPEAARPGIQTAAGPDWRI